MLRHLLLFCLIFSLSMVKADAAEDTLIDSLYNEAYSNFATEKGLQLAQELFNLAEKENNVKIMGKAKLIEAKHYENTCNNADEFEKRTEPLLKWLHDNQCLDDYYHVQIYLILKYIDQQLYMDAYNRINTMYEEASRDNSTYGIQGSYRMKGQLHLKRMAYAEALKCFTTELEYAKANNSSSLYTCYYNMGICEMMLGKYDDALRHVKMSEEKSKNEAARIGCVIQRGYISFLAKDFQMMEECYNELVKYKEHKNIDINLQKEAKRLEIAHYWVQGEYDKAREMYNQLDERIRMQMLPTLYVFKGDYAKAYQALNQYHNYSDSVNAVLSAVDINQFAEIMHKQKLAEEKAILANEVGIQKQRVERLGMLIGLSVFVIIIILALGYIRSQKNRNKVLKAERDAKDKFIQDMSHEIRTPLHQINGFTTILIDNKDFLSPEESHEVVKSIQSSTEQLTSVLNNMLDLYKLESGDVDAPFSEYDASMICMEAIGTVKNDNPNVMVSVSAKSVEPFSFHTCGNILMRVYTILLDNALKFTSKGSVVVGYDATSSPDNILFYVEDTGIGVPDDKAELIFERFEKADRYKPGIGLGLTIARALVHAIKGEIKLDTTYKKGARLVITLPLNYQA